MNRKVKFIILENLMKRYEKGYFSDITFLYFVTQCLFSHLTKENEDETIIES